MTLKEGDTIGKLRERTFVSLIMRNGQIKRGALVAQMGISPATFAHEYTDFLEAYPQIKYNRKIREFRYEV